MFKTFSFYVVPNLEHPLKLKRLFSQTVVIKGNELKILETRKP